MMGPDLFKRWMDMLFWWLPRDSNQPKGPQSPGDRQQGGAGTTQRDDAPSTKSTATTSTASTASGQAKSSTGSSSATTAKSTTEAGKSAESGTSTPPKPSSGASDAVDDLTTIKGVGPAMAARLQDMGIRTFEDLAAAEIKTVTRKLRDQSVVISEKKVEDWVQAARKQG